MPRSSPKYMLVRLKVSKTDPFRQGQTIVIGKTNSPLCPISAMVAYLNSRPSSLVSGPLFVYISGAFLTREKLTGETRLLISNGGLDSSEFAGHSFRIGAATTAASPNLPPWLITEAYHLEAYNLSLYVGNNAGVFQPTNQNHGIFFCPNMESAD